jgi:hypothetical protein
MMRYWVRAGACVGLAWLGASLAGCTGFEQRHGLKPIIDPAAVVSASNNTNIILSALARDARIPEPIAPSDWYLVAKAGFNYVDDQCTAYFDGLFFLNRGREQIKSGIASAGQATAAILGITGASATSIAVVAQAFGFGVSATELIAGTYLYGLPPATTHGFVRKLQAAFRDGAAANRAAIDSAPEAYHMIQRYLDLCLPPRIEAEITKQISSAGTVGVQQGEGSLFSLETFSAPPAHALNPAAGPLVNGRPIGTVLPSGGTSGARVRPFAANDRATRRQDPEPAALIFPDADTILSPYTPALHTRKFILALQDALCVPASERGTVGPDTRALIRIFEDVRYARTPANKDGKLSDAEITLIRGQPPCGADTGLNYFEKSTYTGDANGTRALAQLIDGLNKTKVGPDLPAGTTLAGARPRIMEVRSSPTIASRLTLPLPTALSDQVTRDLLAVLPR